MVPVCHLISFVGGAGLFLGRRMVWREESHWELGRSLQRLLPMRGTPGPWYQDFFPGQGLLCPPREADGNSGEHLGAPGVGPLGTPNLKLDMAPLHVVSAPKSLYSGGGDRNHNSTRRD